MNCSISGNTAVNPVVSPRSGRVFERTVVEAYILQHGTDPISGSALKAEDLIPLSAEPILPKTPATASIPGLLVSLQREYDAIVLEAYELRRELQQTRTELSSALVRNDASLRVISRLSSERDESRAALYELDAPAPKRRAVDAAVLTAAVDVNKIQDTALRLSKARKAMNKVRKKLEYQVLAPVPGNKVVAGPYTGPLGFAHQILVSNGGHLSQLPFNDWEEEIKVFKGTVPESCEDTLTFDNRLFFVTSTAVLENNRPVCDRIANARYHPAGYIFGIQDNALVAYDKDFRQLDFETNVTLDAFEIHPDGDLIFCMTDSGIELYSFKRNEVVATIDVPATHLAFSENGYFVAIANAAGLHMADLRAGSAPKVVDTEVRATKIGFDATGRLLVLLDEDGTLSAFEIKAKTLALVGILAPDVSDFAWLDQRLITVLQSDAEIGESHTFKRI